MEKRRTSRHRQLRGATLPFVSELNRSRRFDGSDVVVGRKGRPNQEKMKTEKTGGDRGAAESQPGSCELAQPQVRARSQLPGCDFSAVTRSVFFKNVSFSLPISRFDRTTSVSRSSRLSNKVDTDAAARGGHAASAGRIGESVLHPLRLILSGRLI